MINFKTLNPVFKGHQFKYELAPHNTVEKEDKFTIQVSPRKGKMWMIMGDANGPYLYESEEAAQQIVAELEAWAEEVNE